MNIIISVLSWFISVPISGLSWLISKLDPIIENLQKKIKCIHKKIKYLKSKCKSRGQKIYELFSEDKNFIDSLLNIIIIILALVIALNNVFNYIYNYIYSLFKESYPCPIQKLELIGSIVFLAILFVLIKFLFFDIIARKLKKLRLFLLFLSGFLLVKAWSTNCKEQSDCDPENFLICKISSVVCNSMDFLTAKNVLQFTNIIQTITIILIVIILCLLYRELSRPSGIVIQAFEYEQLNKEKKLLVDGKFIAELLAAELHHIEHIYNSLEDGQLKIKPGSSLAAVCRENINFPLAVFKGDNLETAFSAMGSISVPNQLSLQIGSLLLALKQLWPQGTVQIISGRIKRDNLTLQITARYEKSNHKSEVHAYKVPSESTELKTPQISDLIEELAYRIVLDLSPKVSKTSSWKAFKFYTQALYCICQYERTKSAKKLDEARTLCEDASRIDKNFSKLGDLLSLIGFYYLGADQYLKAESTLTKAMKINPNSYLVLAVYGHKYYYLGDYNTALEYYTQAQTLEPSRYEFYIRIGVLEAINGNYDDARKNLEKSKDFEFQNHAADSALAWIDFLTYLEKLEEPKEKLDSAYNNLKEMGQERTDIDYSNLAVVSLYHGNKYGETFTKTVKENFNKFHVRDLDNSTITTLKDLLKSLLNEAIEEIYQKNHINMQYLKDIVKNPLEEYLLKSNVQTLKDILEKRLKKEINEKPRETLKKPVDYDIEKLKENTSRNAEKTFKDCDIENLENLNKIIKEIFQDFHIKILENWLKKITEQKPQESDNKTLNSIDIVKNHVNNFFEKYDTELKKNLKEAVEKTMEKATEEIKEKLFQEILENAHKNWQRSLELCPDETISDQLKHKFYEYLVKSSEANKCDNKSSDRNLLLNQIDNILKYRIKDILPQALISDLIKDAKIILFNCIANNINDKKKKDLIKKILSNDKIEEETYVFCDYEIISQRMYEPMQDLIKTLERYQIKCRRNN